MTRAFAILCFLATAARAEIYCASSTPLAFKGDAVELSAWNHAGALRGATWSSEARKIEKKNEKTIWTLTDVIPGRYHATVTAEGGSCTVELFYQFEPVFRGNVREPAQSLLLNGKLEPAGYGLYTYILFGSPPADSDMPRAKKTLEVYAALIVPLEQMESYFDRQELNVITVPVTLAAQPKQKPSADELLKCYGFARARALLDKIDPNLRRGPYLVSSLTPLTKGLSHPYLLQDLSSVPPDVVAFWVRHFLNEAAQQHSWNATTFEGIALRTRTAIAVAAQALPDVTKGLSAYLKLVKQGS